MSDYSLFSRSFYTFAAEKHTNDCIMSTQTMNNVIANYLKTQPILKAWLFGSFARGEETPLSDVDLLVQYDENARISLLKHCAIMNDLEELFFFKKYSVTYWTNFL